MKKSNWLSHLISGGVALLVVLVYLFVACPAINVQNPSMWVLAAVASLIYLVGSGLVGIGRGNSHATIINNKEVQIAAPTFRNGKLLLIPAALLLVMVIGIVGGSQVFNARQYASILTVTDSDFATDLSESVGTDSIALMDTASAQMLGDREIGSLSHVVSQYDVANAYTQIDYQGKPIKVAPLEYAGFFKWMNNKQAGATGYVTVDPVSMSASFVECAGMKYIPSAYFFQDAARHMWTQYPTLILENLHFEIDESGKPYYVASVIKKSIFLFGGKTVSGCVVMDPVSGDCVRYDLADVPRWVDVVIEGNLICDQYDWHGLYQNGYLNSLFAKNLSNRMTVEINPIHYFTNIQINYYSHFFTFRFCVCVLR